MVKYNHQKKQEIEKLAAQNPAATQDP